MTRNTETKTINDEHNLSRKEKEKLEEIAKEKELFQKMEDINKENMKIYEALKSLISNLKYVHPVAMHALAISLKIDAAKERLLDSSLWTFPPSIYLNTI